MKGLINLFMWKCFGWKYGLLFGWIIFLLLWFMIMGLLVKLLLKYLMISWLWGVCFWLWSIFLVVVYWSAVVCFGGLLFDECSLNFLMGWFMFMYGVWFIGISSLKMCWLCWIGRVLSLWILVLFMLLWYLVLWIKKLLWEY